MISLCFSLMYDAGGYGIEMGVQRIDSLEMMERKNKDG